MVCPPLRVAKLVEIVIQDAPNSSGTAEGTACEKPQVKPAPDLGTINTPWGVFKKYSKLANVVDSDLL